MLPKQSATLGCAIHEIDQQFLKTTVTAYSSVKPQLGVVDVDQHTSSRLLIACIFFEVARSNRTHVRNCRWSASDLLEVARHVSRRARRGVVQQVEWPHNHQP